MTERKDRNAYRPPPGAGPASPVRRVVTLHLTEEEYASLVQYGQSRAKPMGVEDTLRLALYALQDGYAPKSLQTRREDEVTQEVRVEDDRAQCSMCQAFGPRGSRCQVCRTGGKYGVK